MNSPVSLGLLLRFYKRALPAQKLRSYEPRDADEKLMLTLGYYDAMLIRKIHTLSTGGAKETRLPEAIEIETESLCGGFMAHQQVVLLADKPLDEECVLPGDGLFAVSFFDIGDNRSTPADWTSEKIEIAINELSSRFDGWPISIRVYLTTGVNTIAAVIQTDLPALEDPTTPWEKAVYNTFPAKVLAMLQAIRSREGDKYKDSLGMINDSYTIFGFGFDGNTSKTELNQYLSWRLQVRTRSGASPDAFRAKLLHAVHEACGSEKFPGEIGPLQYHSGMNDFSINFSNMPFLIMKKLYSIDGFISDCSKDAQPSGDDIFAYLSNYYTEIVDTTCSSKNGGCDSSIEQYKPNWQQEDFIQAKKSFELIREKNPSLYSSVNEMVTNYEQNIILNSHHWIDKLYTPILKNLMLNVLYEYVFRCAWGRSSPDPSRFIDQFERTLQHALHSNAYYTNTKGYHLSQFTFMPRLLTGFTALVNNMAAAYEQDEGLKEETYEHRFLLSAHAAHCSGISTHSVVRDVTGPFGICLNIWAPRHMLFRPAEMIELIMHEAGHYLAPKLRNIRTECLLDMSLNTVLRLLTCRWENQFMVPLTLDRIQNNYEADRPGKNLLITVNHYRKDMLKSYHDTFKEKMDIVQRESLRRIQIVENNHGMLEFPVSKAIAEACDNQKSYGSFVQQYMNEALGALLSEQNKWTDILYSYMRSSIMAYSRDVANGLHIVNRSIDCLAENWKYLRQRVGPTEFRFAGQCLNILSDIASDLFMVMILNMDIARYLTLQQAYNIPPVQYSIDYRTRIETPAINLRIMTILNVYYGLKKSEDLPQDLGDNVDKELLQCIRKAYNNYMWIIKNKKESDMEAELLEILYNYGAVRKYAEAIRDKLKNSLFITSYTVLDIQKLYKKALNIGRSKEQNKPCEIEEHDFFVGLLKMNFDISGALYRQN